MSNDQFEHGEITGQILKSFFETYNKIGYGFNKEIYLNAMELAMNQTPFKAKKRKTIDIKYEMDVIGQIELDLIVDNKIVVLITATDSIMDREVRRLFNFLKQKSIIIKRCF